MRLHDTIISAWAALARATHSRRTGSNPNRCSDPSASPIHASTRRSAPAPFLFTLLRLLPYPPSAAVKWKLFFPMASPHTQRGSPRPSPGAPEPQPPPVCAQVPMKLSCASTLLSLRQCDRAILSKRAHAAASRNVPLIDVALVLGAGADLCCRRRPRPRRTRPGRPGTDRPRKRCCRKQGSPAGGGEGPPRCRSTTRCLRHRTPRSARMCCSPHCRARRRRIQRRQLLSQTRCPATTKVKSHRDSSRSRKRRMGRDEARPFERARQPPQPTAAHHQRRNAETQRQAMSICEQSA